MGGLGNQLFQVFALIAYCLRNQLDFVFPYDEYTDRTFKRKTYWNSLLSYLKPYTAYNKDKYNHLRDIQYKPEYYYEHHYQPVRVVSPNENVILCGYFQSYKYFEDQYDKICSLMRLNDKLKHVLMNYPFINHLPEETTVSIHFRRGDYIELQHSHNLLSLDYYRKAFQTFLEKCDKDKTIIVYYFCEIHDLPTVKDFIADLQGTYPSLQFVHVSETISDWEQMLLMSLCDSNIIANSTFSWWGAYFNKNPNKIVCYPKQWFGPVLSHNYTGDMFPKDWICIS
jgi:hypothetical protein